MPIADCQDCAWAYEDPDLVDVSDAADAHGRKEFHDVDIQRVATDGGRRTDARDPAAVRSLAGVGDQDPACPNGTVGCPGPSAHWTQTCLACLFNGGGEDGA